MKQAPYIYTNSTIFFFISIYPYPLQSFGRDLGVDLRAGNGRVPHHLGNALYRNTSLQSLRAETVATDVVIQRSTNGARQAHYSEMSK